MATETRPLPAWMKGLAVVLLLVTIPDFVKNIHLGIMRALDLYPPDNAQVIGYDFARVLILGFPLWVGWRILSARSKRSRTQN